MKIGLEQHEKNLMEKYERPLSVKHDLTAHAFQCFERTMEKAGLLLSHFAWHWQ
jgi:hypothetical protein